ncbi:hypothetical protein PR003_g30825 [Phytophthora rubi]|uniref:Uncharacterized protein n=1 Tax=Phytophthora rubi TaxID=129364 RepID=A0A6A4BCW7_9STRA|nr:hypothetical protein PR002_g29425 [Phytophthora rubi]KAE8963233.1 hypothetical protein PR001_g29441 [Phytophthora rubi]KAE9270419.1 hypothetical protein PR003_g30825 [Phytophthora rubi]
MNVLATAAATITIPTTIMAATVGKKRALSESDACALSAASVANYSLSIVESAGHDDDGEEILVEAEPLPHEIATDPALRCRYPSKHCLRTRTVKKTGALHSMCAFHRAKANRNQRRLEKRKRLRLNCTSDVAESAPMDVGRPHLVKQEPLAVESTTLLHSTFSSPSFKSLQPGQSTPVSMSLQPQFQSPREVAAEFEPFRTPAALFPEDLEELCELVEVNARQARASPLDDAEFFDLMGECLL